jgi:hypothetical protein
MRFGLKMASENVELLHALYLILRAGPRHVGAVDRLTVWRPPQLPGPPAPADTVSC